jgi:hypothetical protein
MNQKSKTKKVVEKANENIAKAASSKAAKKENKYVAYQDTSRGPVQLD